MHWLYDTGCCREPVPAEVLDIVAQYFCDSWRSWLRWRGVSRRYNCVDWYGSLGHKDLVFVPAQAATIRDALAEVNGLDGLVAVLPGVYRESVRLTKDVTVVGWSPIRDRCVIESVRWEPCVEFAGLGRRLVEGGGVWSSGTGENASVRHLCMRVRNKQQSCAVRVVRGAPSVTDCSLRDGGVFVSGELTDPLFLNCSIQGSKGCGVRVTDRARGRFVASCVSGCGGHGLRVDRGAGPIVDSCRLVGNQDGSIRLLPCAGAVRVRSSAATPPGSPRWSESESDVEDYEGMVAGDEYDDDNTSSSG